MKAAPLSLFLSLCMACAAKSTPPPKTAAAAPTGVSAPGPSQLELQAAAEAAEARNSVERIFVIAPSDKAPALGPEGAKVRLEVCSDFQCPFCARLAPTVHELADNYGELVRVVWRDCPLPFHDHALSAAEAAYEVFTQAGDKGFWAYHDALFQNQQGLDAEGLVTLAKGVEGVDAQQVRAALLDHRHLRHIQGELQALVDSGAAAGGFGTPATFVNGRLISGAQPYQTFENAVEAALQESPEARAKAEADSKAAYPMARVRHILIQYKGAQGAEPKVTRSKEEARALAEQLRRRIVEQHADMAQLARENSDCPSAPEGGELGRFTRGELVPEFESALFAMAPGQISQVVETPFGYHVILREE
jgi:protein-disulfide isomerase